MTNKAEKQKIWKYNELKNLYQNTAEVQLGDRLLRILRMASEKGSLMESKNHYPSFGLRGKSGKRIMSFWSPEKHHCSPPGSVHLFINPKRYAYIEERDRLVEKINKMLSFRYDIGDIYRSRTSKKSLADLSEDEFSTFLGIIEEYSY